MRGWDRARFRWALGIAAAFGAIVLLWLLTGLGGKRGTVVFSDVAVTLSALAAVGALTWVSRRTEGRVQLGWGLLAAGTAAFAAGEVLWTFYEVGLRVEVPYPGPPDVLYLAGYPLLAAGIMVFARWITGLKPLLQQALDGIIVGISLLVVSWVTVLDPILEASQVDQLATWVSLGYPMLDILVASAVVVVAANAPRGHRASVGWVGLGLFLWVLADSAFAALEVTAGYSAHWLDAAWVLGYLAMGLGALHPSNLEVPWVEQESRNYGSAAVLAPYLPVSMALGVAVWVYLTQGGLDLMVFSLGITLVAVLSIRQVVVFEENADLTRQLARTQERFTALTENVEDILWIGDLEADRIEYVSPAFERLFQRAPGEVLDDPNRLLASMHPDDIEDLMTVFAPGGLEEGARTVEHRVVRPDGSVRWLQSQWTLTEGTGSTRLVGVSRDITARKEAEAARMVAAEHAHEVQRLEQMDAFKTQFLNTAAHELSTPLTPVKFQLEALRSPMLGELNDAQGRALEILDRNVARFARLVRDLLDSARLQSGSMKVRMSATRLTRLLEDTVEQFRGPAQELGITLEAQIDPGLEAVADGDRVSQVLVNLLDNALKFTPEGGCVKVRAKQQDGWVRVEVEDDGVGLTEEQVGCVFDPFTQVHQSLDPDRPGTGLGLYISRGIAAQHGGRLTATSPGPDQGTTFTLALPVAGPQGSGLETEQHVDRSAG